MTAHLYHGGCLGEPQALRKQEPHRGELALPWLQLGSDRVLDTFFHMSELTESPAKCFEFLPCHLGAMRPGANDFNPPRLNFLLCKLGITFNLLQLL